MTERNYWEKEPKKCTPLFDERQKEIRRAELKESLRHGFRNFLVGIFFLATPILWYAAVEKLLHYLDSNNGAYMGFALIFLGVLLYGPWIMVYFIHKYKTEVRLRRQQMADLFEAAFLSKDKDVNNVFSKFINELISEDPGFFINIAKNNFSVIVELINSNPVIFDPDDENSPLNYNTLIPLPMSGSVFLLRSSIDPIIVDRLYQLARENKHALKEMFEKNPFFVTLFEKRNKDFVRKIRGYLNIK